VTEDIKRQGDNGENGENEKKSASRHQTTTPELKYIPTELLAPSEFCRRILDQGPPSSVIERQRHDIREREFQRLKRDIKNRGLIQPLAVVPEADGTYMVCGGARRLRALQELGWETVPCAIHPKGSPVDLELLAMRENGLRLDLHPVEMAWHFSRLHEQGLTQADIADMWDTSQASVSETMSILELPEYMYRQIDTRRDSPFKMTHAVHLARLAQAGRHSEVAELFYKIRRFGLTTKEVRKTVDFILSGDADQLPDVLRSGLLSDHLTPGVARLYLQPESVVLGSGSVADERRRLARALRPEARRAFIMRAVKERWSGVKAQERLRERLRQMAAPPIHKPSDCAVVRGALRRAIETLRREGVSAARDASYDQRQLLRKDASTLKEQVEIFLDRMLAASDYLRDGEGEA